MKLVNQLYDWLSHGPTPDCDRIFAAALVRAEPAWAERIVRVLLGRGNEASWAALIGRYPHLPPEVHARLHESGELTHAGIALASKSPCIETRTNALLALEDRPDARMAYILSAAIRDPAPKVRALAAQTLRKTTDIFLDRPPPLVDADHAVRRAYEAERQQLVLASEEALRTFDLHSRREVLETALWFARDLGEVLWQKLRSRRSRASVVTADHLLTWNHPRLAHFLVSALKRPAWRAVAGQMLKAWCTAPQVTALLGESDLLDDPKIRDQLAAIQNPRWFTQIDTGLSELPTELQQLAPRWVCHAGYREREKTSLLSHWVQAVDQRVHRATVYALAEVNDSGARALLRQVAASDSPLASFARWSLPGSKPEARPAATASQPAEGEPPGPASDAVPAAENESDTDFAMLWQTCRRMHPSTRGELIAALRENANVWRTRLKAHLRSPDPRDRILAIQVISTDKLAAQFRGDLEPLMTDSVEGIRRLTQTLVRAISRQPLPPHPPAPEPPRRDATPDEQAQDAARHELRALLERVSSGTPTAADADLIVRVRDLLQQVYSGPAGAAPAGVVEEDRR